MSWSSWGRVRGSPIFSTEDEILERFGLLLRRTVLGGQRSNFLGMAGSQKKASKNPSGELLRVAEFSFFNFLFSLLGRQTMESSGKQGICTIQVPWCHDCHNLKRRTYHHSEVWKNQAETAWSKVCYTCFCHTTLPFFPEYIHDHACTCTHDLVNVSISLCGYIINLCNYLRR